MAEMNRFDTALERFDAALNAFESSIAKKQNDTLRLQQLVSEAQVLQSERQKLARDLDLLKTKAAELVDTSRQAAGKIDNAMARIRSVLHSNSGA
jgi:predicted  nucleic acid-binding Zn-ribbon protein